MYTQEQNNAFRLALHLLLWGDNRIALDALYYDILKMVKKLEPKQGEIILHLWGLSNEPPKSVKQIAHVFNLSEAKVHNIESKAYAKLRKNDILACLLRAILTSTAKKVDSLHCAIAGITHQLDGELRGLLALKDFTNELKTTANLEKLINTEDKK